MHGIWGTAAATRAVADAKAVPQQCFAVVTKTLAEARADPAGANAEGGAVSLVKARMANKVLQAHTARARLQKVKDEVVDRARAAMVYDQARREPDT
jgi:hypothetical protein